jgi:hypothetical protein
MPAIPQDNLSVSRSGFVTGLAWTFIALSGFATLIAILQNVMLTLVFPAEEMRGAMQKAERVDAMPGFAKFMFENFRLLFAGFLVVSITTLVSSIGLLKRKNWARLVFVGIMGLGVVWNLSSIAMPFFMSSMIPPMPENAPTDFSEQFDVIWKVMTVFTILIALVFSALFIWIIRKLLSPEVRREFAL